jgi:hypothetical protein
LVANVKQCVDALYQAHCEFDATDHATRDPEAIRSARQAVDKKLRELLGCDLHRLDRLGVLYLHSPPGEWGKNFADELKGMPPALYGTPALPLLQQRDEALGTLLLLVRNHEEAKSAMPARSATAVEHRGPQPVNPFRELHDYAIAIWVKAQNLACLRAPARWQSAWSNDEVTAMQLELHRLGVAAKGEWRNTGHRAAEVAGVIDRVVGGCDSLFRWWVFGGDHTAPHNATGHALRDLDTLAAMFKSAPGRSKPKKRDRPRDTNRKTAGAVAERTGRREPSDLPPATVPPATPAPAAEKRRVPKAERERLVSDALKKLTDAGTQPARDARIRAVRIAAVMQETGLPKSSAATTDAWKAFEDERKRRDLSPTPFRKGKRAERPLTTDMLAAIPDAKAADPADAVADGPRTDEQVAHGPKSVPQVPI